MLRHAWLAEALPESIFQPAFTPEVAEVRLVSHPAFTALYAAGQIRMDHTELFHEDALREWAQMREDSPS